MNRFRTDYGTDEIGLLVNENTFKIGLSGIGIAKNAFGNRIRGVRGTVLPSMGTWIKGIVSCMS